MTLPGLAPDTLFSLAQDALHAVARRWPGSPVTPLPNRQYVSNGIVIWDKSQLTVQVERVFGMEGDVQQEIWLQQAPLVGFRGVVLNVALLRDVPDVTTGAGDQLLLPDPIDIERSAFDIHSDAILMWNTVLAAQQAGELAACNGLAFEDWTPLSPDGGLGGGMIRVRMALL